MMNQYNRELSRRSLLKAVACGFGSLALTGLQQANALTSTSLLAKPALFPQKAKRVIFIFMAGGPSHVDTFDYKPELFSKDGKKIDFVGVRTNTFGKESKRTLMKPLWDFKQHGQCGKHVSSLFPHIAKHVDELAFIHSMHTEGVAHGPSTLFMHTGATNLVRPSMGSWISYGLGTENQNLPAFVTISPSSSKGGPRNYGNAFLPSIHQGTALGRAGDVSDAKIRNIENSMLSNRERKNRFDLLQGLNSVQNDSFPLNDNLEATIENYELAWRMQMEAPELTDLKEESKSTQKIYGIDEKETEYFGKQCLLARRMVERGVRFVSVNYSDESANPRWDQHGNLAKHAVHARATDKPVAGLLQDLKSRGLLEDTLVWWGGEFGRTPFSQNNDGRDHNPRGFTVFLAGGGIKPGFSYGATDEIGSVAVDKPVHMHDLHATLLHALGLDHERLTYRHSGRDFRLTDVHGSVVEGLFS
ncbi:MAG: DUF1501 domain-containing protein [Opitutales bacterium]|nr:DUF1501 domain-containing protein [Opitutales bacterium]